LAKRRIMELAKLLLKYVKVLVWPALAVYGIGRFGGYFESFIKRYTGGPEEINTGVLALSSNLRKEVGRISQDIPDTDIKNREILRQKVLEFARDEFGVLAANFYAQPPKIRHQIAKELFEIGKDVKLEDLFEFANSPLIGERAAAGIGLRAHLSINPDLATDKRIIDAIGSGLGDMNPTVRFRYVGALMENDALASEFEWKLKELSEFDNNKMVAKRAKQTLRERDTDTSHHSVA